MRLSYGHVLAIFGLVALGGCHAGPDLATRGLASRPQMARLFADPAPMPVSLTKAGFAGALAQAPAHVALQVASRTGATDLPIEIELYDVGEMVHTQKYVVRNRSAVAFKGTFEVIYYDQYDNPIGEQKLSGLTSIPAGGAKLNNAAFTGMPARGELVRGAPQDWPNQCEISGTIVSPCPVSLTVKTHNFDISQPLPIVALALNQ